MALPPVHMKARKRFGQNFLVNDLSSSVKSFGFKRTTAEVTLGAGLNADGGTISIGITCAWN